MNNEMSRQTITHSCSVRSIDPDDCVSREVRAFYAESMDMYLIELITQWDEKTAPITTRMKLSAVAVEMLAQVLWEITNNRPMYEITIEAAK